MGQFLRFREAYISSLLSKEPFKKFESDILCCIGVREAFKRKTRKYIGLLPILGGGGVPPDQYISGFFLRKKHL